MTFYDAHTHRPTADCALAVLNSAEPGDWARVAAQAASDPRLIPSYGLHPWYCADAPAGWLAQLRAHLLENPRAQVGEIGLDRHMPRHLPPTPIEQQLAAFTPQLALAAELGRVATIHCTRAHGLLLDVLRATKPLPRLLLHAYSGSAELVKDFASLGACFSFGAGQLAPQRTRARAAARAVPPERLLVETDMPKETAADAPNAPQQLETPRPDLAQGYRTLAELRDEPFALFAERIGINFRQLFPQ
ncbi:hypothetical protein AXK11_02090 [Cephaloticoccus primus]|uniref:Hydrolase TatD n=1 Tax=Cephaloticoccus primus TaxID=1548207 RepID=A0A139SSS1_9BACT|nr:TatD family hydrolase [Cephaloticoccus primus]KXU37607.1 hypothetical protein AXK11_02090 [Cephaloticoccus primus]